VIAKKARAWISRRASREPFFAYVAPYAPHGPYVDPPAHTTEFAGERAPRNPSFNEADVSDKPGYVSDRPLLTVTDEAGIDQRYESGLRMMLAVDDMVKGIVADLRAAGELDNTYIFVTSDNGFMQGEHRFSSGKGKPYEEASEVPLLVRGPGITPGTRISDLAVNTDLYETFSDIAGAGEDRDGRSLLPLLHGDAPSWRNQILLENLSGDGGQEPDDGGAPDDSRVPDYYGIRTDRYKYVEYATGEKELYDLDNDPYELESIHATADRALLSDLQDKLDALKSCTGQTCRTAEDAQ
jgi:N-acetylglucosamine-6-sulfatase